MGYIEKGRAKTVTKVILWLVVISFIATIFVQWGMQRGGISFSGNPFSINGDSISVQDLVLSQNFYAFVRERLSPYAEPMEMLAWSSIVSKVGQEVSGPLLMLMDRNNENTEALAPVVVTMVGEKVLADRALKAGFTVSDQAVGATIARVFTDENGNFIGQDNVERNLAAYGVGSDNETKFKRMIKRHLLVRSYTTSLFASIQPAFKEQVRELYVATQTVDFRLVRFPASRYLSEIEAADAEVRSYFDENKDKFLTAEMLVFDSQIYASSLEITDAEVQAYYETNKEASFSEPEKRSINRIVISLPEEPTDEQLAQAQAKANEIIESLKEPGIAFGTVLDNVTQEDGVSGERMQGLTLTSDYNQSFINAVFGLAEVNDFTQSAVRTDAGLELIQLTELVDGPVRPLDEVRAEIMAMIRDERGPEEARIKADEYRSRAVTEEWQALADEANYVSYRPSMAAVKDETTIYNLDLGGNASGDVRALESLFSLNQGDLSNVLTFGSNFAIFRVAAKDEALTDEYEALKPVVRLDYRLEQSEQLAEQRAADFVRSLPENAAVDDFNVKAAEIDITPESVSTNLLQERQYESFGITPPYGSELVKKAMAGGTSTVIGPLKRETSSVVMFVTSVVEFDPADYSTQQPQLAQNLLMSWSYGQDVSGITEQDAMIGLEAYLRDAIDGADMNVDTSLAMAIFGPQQQAQN